ncbi:hypothetical protein AN958_05246 [Leucoagaricus sp. SymC.cos]|nr:hypothetical protein AN958_05246 [Leucoagaricus sp. SymC.cos]
MYPHGQNPASSHGSHQLETTQTLITHGTTANPVLINRSILLTSGQFAGETIRYELKEIQKACLGRKYARVDRRPLDPPPVVLVHIWRYSPETGREEEVNYEEVQTHGLLCTVDLFPVPAKTSKDSPPSSTAANPRTSRPVPTNDGFVHFNPSGPSPIPSLTPSPPYRPQSYGPSDIVYYYEGIYPLLERSKTTQVLVGATFVQPVLVELSGKKCIVFVFSDLAVKSEGTFTLRYRIFDLFSPNVEPRGSSQERNTSLSILAECWAKGSFRIYSTKEFPGLPASTDLTKQLARWGVRLNIRETERRRRRRSTMDEPEEEYHSDGEIDDGVDESDSRDHQGQPTRRTANIRPRPLTSQSQANYRSSPSSSPTQPPPHRQISPTSTNPTSAFGYDRHRPRQDVGGDNEYEEEVAERREDQGPGIDVMEYNEHTGYNQTDRPRNPSRTSVHSGLPAYQAFTYPTSTSTPFDPAPTSSGLEHNQPHSSSPVHADYEYDPSVPQPVHPTFVPSGLRSSVNGVGFFSNSQNAPTGSASFPRYGPSARRRDSGGGSSTTSRRSGGSDGSVGEFPGMTQSFMYGIGGGHGTD